MAKIELHAISYAGHVPGFPLNRLASIFALMLSLTHGST
jgi:hypothetical protein